MVGLASGDPRIEVESFARSRQRRGSDRAPGPCTKPNRQRQRQRSESETATSDASLLSGSIRRARLAVLRGTSSPTHTPTSASATTHTRAATMRLDRKTALQTRHATRYRNPNAVACGTRHHMRQCSVLHPHRRFETHGRLKCKSRSCFRKVFAGTGPHTYFAPLEAGTSAVLRAKGPLRSRHTSLITGGAQLGRCHSSSGFKSLKQRQSHTYLREHT